VAQRRMVASMPSRPSSRRRLALPALVLAVALLSGVSPASTTAAPPPTVESSFRGGHLRGMVVNSFNVPPATMVTELRRIKSLGVNTAAVYINLFVATKYGNAVQRDPVLTPSDDQLRTFVTIAHAEGLDVTFTPILYSKAEPELWRGVFTPSDPNAFFLSWRGTIGHYASLAQKTGVKMLAIGSEQRSLHGYADQWRQVAADVRARFGGLVTYHSGKDAGPDVVPFWDAVDVVSISGYYTLTKNPRPTYDELLWIWVSQYLPYVRSIHEATGKPVIFAEIGYISADSSTANPARGRRGGVYNPKLQSDAYAAVMDAFAHESWFKGLAWFRWDIGSVVNDTSYTPRGKPAEALLKARWAL
jgi:hypothetical protein